MTRTALPLHGRDRQALCDQLLEMRAADIPLDRALMNLLVPYADDDIYDVGTAAQAMFGHENALFARVIPSVDRLQTEVLGFALSLQNAPDGAGAAITSGGTENIFSVCLAAREFARKAHPGLREPEIVVARTAHPALHKTAHILCMNVRVTEHDEDFRAVPSAFESVIGQ